VLGTLTVRGRPAETLRDVAGLLRSSPGAALLLSLAMLTLMGLPPTPGFWGKLALFGSALASASSFGASRESWVVALVIVAVLNTALAAAYYLRVIAACLVYEADPAAQSTPREAPRMGAAMCGFLLLAFAVYPNVLLNAGRGATAELRGESRAPTAWVGRPSAGRQ
jgi:NADH-quinone oxidoreductase subunit N